MKKVVERLMSGATRLLVLALGLGLATTGWAATLSSSGYIYKDSANPTAVFSGVAITDIALGKYVLSGNIGGGNVNTDGEAGAYNYSVVAVDNVNSISSLTVQFQRIDGGYCKCVEVEFTEASGNVINAYAKRAGYKSGAALGSSNFEWNGTVVTDATSAGYGVYDLSLTLADQKPLAVWDGAKGDFKKSTVNNVTFGANGNTVPADGSYVKITGSYGALFDLGADYSYVVAEFTVTNLNETAEANRVLALWSPSAYDNITAGTTTTLGVYLDSAARTTHGIWTSKTWSDSSSSIKSEVSLDSERTFALTVEDSNVLAANDSKIGVHLFELTGDSPNTAIFGGSGNIVLRANQTYRLLSVGGLAKGTDLSAFTDLVVTKVVIYASNHRQFTSGSSGIVDVSSVENPTTETVANGETISASTLNTETPVCVYTEAGATLNLDASLASSVYFFGSIAGDSTGLTLGSANDKVTLTDASYVPVVKGYGTVIYPNNTIPSASSTWLTSSEWAGTLSLSGIQGSGSGQPGWYAPFHNYGSTNSTIKVSGFTGFFAAGNFESPAALEIAAGSTFTLNNGNNGNSMTFAKLKGSGDIVICGDNGPAIQYVMRDASEFAGNITVSQSGSSSFKKSIVLGGGSSYNYNTGKYQKQICVLGNVTIAAGKTWVADSGIVVDGTLTLAASDSSMPVVASGTGKIVCINNVPNNSGLAASTWTGTLEINADTTSGTISDSTQFMNAASKLNLAEGYLSLTGVSELPGEVSVASGAILYLGKTDATTASVKVGTLDGAISTELATSLETLTLDIGTARTFDWTKINQGNNQNLTVNISLTEGAGENGTTVFIPANFNGNNTYNYTIKHIDGTAISATPVINGETGAVTFTYIPQVNGDACWHAYEFNSTYTSSGVHYYPDSVSTDQRDCRTWDYANPDLCDDTDPNKGGNKFIYTIIRPGPNNAYDYPTEWSAAIRCTTPSTANSIIVAFGNSNRGNYIALVSGDTAGKVRLVSGSGSNPVGEITAMTVANPTTSQHVYVFTKTASAVTVYCDGDLIVSKPLSLVIGSGFQFGTIYGGTTDGCGLSRVSSRETAGMVDYTRLYDFAISLDMIQKLAADDQYESSTPTYSREVSDSPWWYTSEGTWLKSDDSTLVGVPDVSGIVDLTATADATMTVNLPAAPVYEKLTFQGAGAVTLVKDGSSPKIATAKLVVKTNVTAPYDIADFSGARVSVDTGKVLTFDFSTYPLESVTGVTTQQVTGVTTRADDRYAVVASAKSAWNSNLSLIYDPVEYVYSVVIAPAALVTKNNTTVAYPTVADALTALSTDAGTVRLLVDYDQDITLSAGQTLDVGSTTYSGTVSVTGTNVEMAQSGTTYAAVDNSSNTWAPGAGSDKMWNTAANWSNGVIPNTYTAVTFPASAEGHTVKLTLNNTENHTPEHVCASMELVGDVTFQRGDSVWAYVLVGGNITGSGTMTLEQVGIKGNTSSVTVECPVVGNATANDNFFSGGDKTFTFTNTVDVVAGEFKADYSHAIFNGPVTIRNGGYVKAHGSGSTTTFNGGISVPENAAASLTVDSGTHTIASTVTLAGGATLTVPTASTTVSGATFETSVADSYVKATTGESTTVYSVAAKRTATMSVGANASLSINGNAVADGDTVKFVPGDVLTITASADTYYTPALTVNEVSQTSPYELTTTDADVTVSVTATLDTYTITIPSVANTTVSVSYTSGSEAQVATAAGDITVDAGTSLTATWTAASGYRITAGASQTINSVAAAQTLAEPTVATKPVAVTDVTFDYYATYATADVTATVTEAGTYTLTVGGKDYNATATGAGPVKFSDVDVSGTELGGTVSYTITQAGASGAYVPSTPEQKGAVAPSSDWMLWDSSHNTVGTWDPSNPSYTDGEAAFTGTNTYTAAWVSTGEVVTVTTRVKFGDVADPEVIIDADAQAAIRLFNNGGVTFQVLTNDNAWAAVSSAGLTPNGETEYTVVISLDYATQKYSAKIDGYQLALTGSDPAVTSFPLAKAASAMQKVSYLGAGSFISLAGQYVSAGYTADIGTAGSATNVVVSSDFVNTYLGDVLASNVSAALSPTNTTKQVNGLNYFASYALGLDPTDEDDKPTIKVETNSEGKFVVTLVDGNGDPIVGAANVALTLKFQSGTDPNSLTTETISSFSEGSATIDPSTMEGNVKYYKVRIDIGAK